MSNSSVEISQFRDTPYTRGFVFVGQAFSASYIFTVAIGATQWIQFSTGDKLIHGIDQIIVPNKGDVTFRMWEGSTITTPGSGAMPSVNMNRKSAKTSTAVFTRDPVVSVPGLTPKRKKNTATPELEKERQQQNYYKRMVNKWKKREAIAVTDDEKRYCRQKVKEWRAKVK